METLTRINKILFFILFIVTFLYIGAPFLISFVFGIFFALLLTPFCNLLEKNKLKRMLASLISTLLVFIVIGIILFLFIIQINQFTSDLTSVEDALQSFITSLQDQISSITNLSHEQQNEIWQGRSDQVFGKIETLVTSILGSVVSTVLNFLLVLIYMFLLLLYRGKISEFAMMYTQEEEREHVEEVLDKIGKVVYHYLLGRAKVMAILGLMYYITFVIFDLPYAILLTIFGALITIIPYIGPLISGILPILFSLIFSGDLQNTLLLALSIAGIQLIESYLLEPLILGKEVKLNPLIVIIAILLGGMIWGVAGMILFVPMFAMFKIISNNIEGLQPVGFLLGGSQSTNQKKKTKPSNSQ